MIDKPSFYATFKIEINSKKKKNKHIYSHSDVHIVFPNAQISKLNL